jgi:hypothetical protein
MYNDPTESYRPLEQMQAVYRNPYEAPSPYSGGMPPVPPALPKQHHIGPIVAWASLLCLVMLLGGVLFGTLLVNGQQKVTQVTPTPPLVPTSTPVPRVSYSASDIYHDFSAHGLGGTNPRDDTNWRCCTYAPEGGALVWTDRASGHNLDIATFKSISEAEVDARQLDNQHFSSTVVHTCLLSYDKTVPPSILSRYVQVMQTYCD